MALCIQRQPSNILAHLPTYLLHELADDVHQLCSHSVPITGTLLRLAGGSCAHLLNVFLRVCFFFFTKVFWKQRVRFFLPVFTLSVLDEESKLII